MLMLAYSSYDASVKLGIVTEEFKSVTQKFEELKNKKNPLKKYLEKKPDLTEEIEKTRDAMFQNKLRELQNRVDNL